MKRIFLIPLMIVLVSALLFGGCAAPAPAPAPPPAKPIELSIAHHVPPGHHLDLATIEMAERIEKETGGRVKFTIYPGETLATSPESVPSVVSGASDLNTAVCTAHIPGRFPMTEAIALPPAILYSSDASPVYWDFAKKFLLEEWAEVKVLGLHVQPAMTLSTTDKPVRTLEDLKGLEIRVPGPIGVATAKALGATPVAIPMPESYEALQKGVCDGITTPYTEIKGGFRLGEVTFYHTDISIMAFDFWVIMNHGKYNALPSDIKTVFDKAGDWIPEVFGKAWDGPQKEGLEFCKTTSGHELITLPPEELARWNERLRTVGDAWAAEKEAAGLPGKKLVEGKYQAIEKFVK